MSDPGRVAIVGGGPAGATCAQVLAAAGTDVTLFEAGRLGEKPCGGGIPSAAFREFPFLRDPSTPRRVVREVILYSPAERTARIPLLEGVHVFRRSDLDGLLRCRAQAAGARILWTRVSGVRRTPAGPWEVLTDLGPEGPFDFLVGADGVRGAVRRTMAGPHDEGDLTLALYGHAPGVSRSEILLKFTGAFAGYLWAFPRTDHVSIGIGAPRRSVTKARLEEELRGFVETHYPEGRPALENLRGYLIPACPRPPSAQPGARWALIGDAGGFVDPITREGIAHAMRSAVALARRLLARGEGTAPGLPVNLMYAHRYRAGFFGVDFLENMVHLAAMSPAIRRVLADLLEGRQSYRGLKSRLVLNALPCGLDLCARLLSGFRARPDGGTRTAS